MSGLTHRAARRAVAGATAGSRAATSGSGRASLSAEDPHPLLRTRVRRGAGTRRGPLHSLVCARPRRPASFARTGGGGSSRSPRAADGGRHEAGDAVRARPAAHGRSGLRQLDVTVGSGRVSGAFRAACLSQEIHHCPRCRRRASPASTSAATGACGLPFRAPWPPTLRGSQNGSTRT